MILEVWAGEEEGHTTAEVIVAEICCLLSWLRLLRNADRKHWKTNAQRRILCYISFKKAWFPKGIS